MNRSQVVIKRKWHHTEFDQVVSLLSQLMTHEDPLEVKEAIIEEHGYGHLVYTAFLENQLLGLITARIEGRPRHGLAELVHLVVSDEVHGIGIGRQLVEHLEKELQIYFTDVHSKLRRFFVLTRETNHSAQEFYKKMGFIPEQFMLNHFYPGKNELVMARYYDSQN